jgi:hypothetical protein
MNACSIYIYITKCEIQACMCVCYMFVFHSHVRITQTAQHSDLHIHTDLHMHTALVEMDTKDQKKKSHGVLIHPENFSFFILQSSTSKDTVDVCTCIRARLSGSQNHSREHHKRGTHTHHKLTHTHIYIHTCMHIYIHICTHTHLHIHTYIHTYIHSNMAYLRSISSQNLAAPL